jgi:hypothetical protein
MALQNIQNGNNQHHQPRLKEELVPIQQNADLLSPNV